jgi:hypothetical protein
MKNFKKSLAAFVAAIQLVALFQGAQFAQAAVVTITVGTPSFSPSSATYSASNTITVTSVVNASNVGSPNISPTLSFSGITTGTVTCTKWAKQANSNSTCTASWLNPGVGTYSITATVAGGSIGSDTYVLTSSSSSSFTVAKAGNVTITPATYSSTYGTAAAAPSYSASGLIGSDALATTPTCAVYTSSDTLHSSAITLSSTTPAGTYKTYCQGAQVDLNLSLIHI